MKYDLSVAETASDGQVQVSTGSSTIDLTLDDVEGSIAIVSPFIPTATAALLNEAPYSVNNTSDVTDQRLWRASELVERQAKSEQVRKQRAKAAEGQQNNMGDGSK